MANVATLPEAKRWMGVTDGSDDEIIQELIDRAETWVEERTGRFFGPAGTSHEEILEGTGTDTLWLQEEPDTLTSVEERDYPGDDWETITAGDDDGYLEQGVRLRRKGEHVWHADKEYRVKYDFGYASTSVPDDVRQLVLDLVKLKYDQRTVNMAVRRDATDSHSYSRAQWTGAVESIPWVRETLERWRWKRVV